MEELHGAKYEEREWSSHALSGPTTLSAKHLPVFSKLEDL